MLVSDESSNFWKRSRVINSHLSARPSLRRRRLARRSPTTRCATIPSTALTGPSSATKMFEFFHLCAFPLLSTCSVPLVYTHSLVPLDMYIVGASNRNLMLSFRSQDFPARVSSEVGYAADYLSVSRPVGHAGERTQRQPEKLLREEKEKSRRAKKVALTPKKGIDPDGV